MLLFVMFGCGCDEPVEPARTFDRPRLVREDPTDAPLDGLSAEQLERFERGDALFRTPYRAVQGLGPLYIERSCTSCHEHDARGPGLVRRIVPAPGLALPFGDVVRPRLAAGARTPLLAPQGSAESIRLPPAVFARGLLEAIDDAWILAQELAQATTPGPPDGRAARLSEEPETPTSVLHPPPRLGRLGHKARRATLEAFVADALHGDMGLTSPARPEEPPNPDGLTDDARPGIDVSAQTVALLVDYVRLLQPPSRRTHDRRGERLFEQVGCADCHVPRARTRTDHPVAALRGVEVALYTDLLLHDMGEGLADGITENAAGPRHWRTAPLVGIRHLRGLLHDGRAATVWDAIDAHDSPGSEASASVARFRALDRADAEVLVAFVEAL
ncbi:MAG: hypothetical protein NZ898_11000 [Myxococcota bacterium]|nr:hypothetical protein [Myxococcota bacterium]MDW8362416.1 di-heme oxidoredictase family protein [Myxococcales bacterium]